MKRKSTCTPSAKKETRRKRTKEELDLVLVNRRSQRSFYHCDKILIKLYNPFKTKYFETAQILNSAYISQNTPVWELFRKYVQSSCRSTYSATVAAQLISNPDLVQDERDFKNEFNIQAGFKTRKKFSGNCFTEIGHRAEPLALATAAYRLMKNGYRGVGRMPLSYIRSSNNHEGKPIKPTCYRPGTIVKRCQKSLITIAASPDAIFRYSYNPSANITVECKTWHKDRALPTCIMEVPTKYLVQLALQMFVTGTDSGILLIFDQEDPRITSKRHVCIHVLNPNPWWLNSLHERIRESLKHADDAIFNKDLSYIDDPSKLIPLYFEEWAKKRKISRFVTIKDLGFDNAHTFIK
jgi:hypothetical protein